MKRKLVGICPAQTVTDDTLESEMKAISIKEDPIDIIFTPLLEHECFAVTTHSLALSTQARAVHQWRQWPLDGNSGIQTVHTALGTSGTPVVT